MKSHKTRTIRYRRKLEGKTNYKKRLKLLLSKKPRLVVRKSLKNITAQIIQYYPTGDKVLFSASSKELEKMGWNIYGGNIVSAYLVGLLIGKKSKDKVKDCILDIGLQRSIAKSRIYAVLNGAVDAGLKIHFSKEMFPQKERINGKHIADYAALLKKENSSKYEKVFSRYIKNNIDPSKIPEHFEKMKTQILGAK